MRVRVAEQRAEAPAGAAALDASLGGGDNPDVALLQRNSPGFRLFIERYCNCFDV